MKVVQSLFFSSLLELQVLLILQAKVNGSLLGSYLVSSMILALQLVQKALCSGSHNQHLGEEGGVTHG